MQQKKHIKLSVCRSHKLSVDFIKDFGFVLDMGCLLVSLLFAPSA